MRKWNRIFGLLLFVATVGLLTATSAFAASPALSVIMPRGCQRGAETELTFIGARFEDAEEIFFYTPGFEVTKLEVPKGNQVKATVKVSPECRLGEHVAQVRTKSGVSEFRTFYVGPFPTVSETEPNTLFDSPQKIDLNVTVSGIVQSEDVDYFLVEAKKGQRLSVEVEGMRLGRVQFDPYVAILDTKRFELASADDTPLVRQDAAASVVVPEDGNYIIEVRESAYGGNGNCDYRLHVGTFPRPTAVYPSGGKIGEELDVKFLGDAAGEFTQHVKLPSALDEEFGLEPTIDGLTAPSPVPFRLFEHGNALEVEPNNGFADATPAELPLAFNGIIETEGDVDCFKFAAKKGQVFDVECFSRRIRSGLDPVMNLYTAAGKSIAGNDDSRGPDSYIRFTAPEDGEYVVRITDHLGRGAADFVYRVEFHAVKPTLTLGIPRVARYSQYRQWIVVPRGNRFATLISASRANFGGELLLEPKDLPPGITMHAETMPDNMTLMPVVFEAAADAPIGGKLIDLTARHVTESTGISGRYTNRADYIIGAPGQSLYWYRDVDRIPVVVADEVPFTLEIIEPKVPLVRNGSMQLKVVAHRKEGFDEQINVQFPFRSPGVSAVSSVNIPKGSSEVLYPLNANANAQVKKWKVYCIGSANSNGSIWVSSQLATLEVTEPYVQFAMQRSATEQGKPADIVCTVTQNTPFEGEATAQLLGLPNKVTAEPMPLTKDATELIFKVATDPASPEGRHKGVICQVVITQNGEPIVHTVGSTELRIDKPIPPKVDAPAAAPVVAKKEAPKPAAPVEKPKKPLTRLEQLRLEAKQKAEAAGGGS